MIFYSSTRLILSVLKSLEKSCIGTERSTRAHNHSTPCFNLSFIILYQISRDQKAVFEVSVQIMPFGPIARRTVPITCTLLRGGQRFSFGTSARPLMPPTPPAEKKWFYKEVWAALQPSVDKITPRRMSHGSSNPNSDLPEAAAKLSSSVGSWTQRITSVRDQGLDMVQRYGFREKLDQAFQQYCRLVTAVKEFFYQKRYQQMGSLMTDGLKRLEDRVRSVREGRPLGRDTGNGTAGRKIDGSCAKAVESKATKDEEKIVVKLTPKPEENA